MPILGDVLADRYRIEALLGAGGMASVYEATDLRLERRVAVKVLAPNLAADATFTARFEREARAMAGFSHPNVVSVFDVDPGDAERGREPFYVMELCDGGSLANRIAAAGRVNPAELVPVIEAIADGLEELHRNALIHRDVKPHNILFSGDRAKLGDFGVARAGGASGGTSLTMPGETVGTLAYLAPELLSGEPGSAASDVYGLAVTAFQGLTGQLPRPAAPLDQVVESRAEPAPLVSATTPELGTAFDEPFARALAPDPARRPSPSAFAAGLAAALEGEDETAVAATVASAVAPLNRPLAAADLEATPVPRVKRQDTPRESTMDRIFTDWRVVLGAIGVVIIAIILTAALGGLLFGGNARAPSASGQASPTISPTFSPPAATAALTPAPSSPVLAALDGVDAAIQAARGGPDGLSGKDANELDRLAGAVRQDVTAGDLATARTDAQTLEDRAQHLTEKLDPARRDPLLSAIGTLVGALAGAA